MVHAQPQNDFTAFHETRKWGKIIILLLTALF